MQAGYFPKNPFRFSADLPITIFILKPGSLLLTYGLLLLLEVAAQTLETVKESSQKGGVYELKRQELFSCSI
jgi:hypothetical protein